MVKWIERETNTQTAVKTQTSKLTNSYSETDIVTYKDIDRYIDKQATSICGLTNRETEQ
jgi:hypothetical protein